MPDTRNVLEEQLRKRGKAISAELPWQLLLFSFVILALAIASYFGMVFGYQPYLESKIEGTNAQIKELEKSIDSEQQKNLINIYSQLSNIKALLNSHIITSTLFDEIEKNTYPQVYYTSLNLSLSEKKLELRGVSQDYVTLVKQLDVLKKSELLNDAILDNTKSTGDGVTFSIRINLPLDKLK